MVSPAYPGSETRLLPPLSAFVSPPPSLDAKGQTGEGEVVASRPTEPQRQLSTHPQRVSSRQGGGAGGVHRAPCSRPLQRRKTRLLTVAAARGGSPQPSRRVSSALRPRPACHPTPGPPRPPPRAPRRSAGAPAAARRRLRAGSPPGRAIEPGSQVRSDLPSPLSRGRLPGLRDLHRQGRAAARGKARYIPSQKFTEPLPEGEPGGGRRRDRLGKGLVGAFSLIWSCRAPQLGAGG